MVTNRSELHPCSKAGTIMDIISVKPLATFEFDLHYADDSQRRFDMKPLLSVKPLSKVTLTLLNAEHPSAWDEANDWVEREGEISNAKLCDIAKLDTLKASRLLATWCEQGLLCALPNRAKRNAAYSKTKLLNSVAESRD
jgi:hypothetical protein